MKDPWGSRLRPKSASDITLRSMSYRIGYTARQTQNMKRESEKKQIQTQYALQKMNNSMRRIQWILIAEALVVSLYCGSIMVTDEQLANAKQCVQQLWESYIA